MHPPTIFLDIDGTIFKYRNWIDLYKEHAELLPGVTEKMEEFENKGCRIILTTGRKESMRGQTEKELRDHGIYYDVLLMGLGGGTRYLINDKKPDGRLGAFAINVERNGGLEGVNIC